MTGFEWIALVFMVAGALFTLLASFGLVRLPDVYCRLSATSKAAPLGIGFVLAGAAMVVRDHSYTLQAIAVGFFVALTSPVAAHVLARAARRAGVPYAPGTESDEPSQQD
ncbi:MAG: monovalent cation/H(+) antiporter subunit G [Planctomycetota bacterium]